MMSSPCVPAKETSTGGTVAVIYVINLVNHLNVSFRPNLFIGHLSPTLKHVGNGITLSVACAGYSPRQSVACVVRMPK